MSRPADSEVVPQRDADLTSHHIEGIAKHGDVPFSVPLISHIAGNLYVGGCINGVPLPEGIEHVVSLYTGETYRYHEEVRSVLAVRMNDVDERPDEAFVWTIAAHVNRACSLGPTLVHCQAGLNRSNLIAAAALILYGRSADDAIELLRDRRTPEVLCNPAFEGWLRSAGAPVERAKPTLPAQPTLSMVVCGQEIELSPSAMPVDVTDLLDVALDAASIPSQGEWEIRDAQGNLLQAEASVSECEQPFYVDPTPGEGA